MGKGLFSGFMRARSRRLSRAAPWRMSASLTSTSCEPERVQGAGEDGGSGDDGGGAVGVEAGDLAALGEREGGELVAELLAGVACEPVPVDPLGVVGVELEVDGGERGGGAGDGDRLVDLGSHVLGDVAGEDAVDVVGERRELGGGGRVGVEVALGVAHGAHAGGHVEGRVRRRGARRRTRCCRRRCRSRASGRRAAVRWWRRRKVSRASSSPEMTRGSTWKRRRRRSASSSPFSASRMALVATQTTVSALVPVEQLAVAGHGVDDALDGRVAEPSAGLESLAEPGHGGLPFDLRELAAVHVGDEESRRVGAEVDHADAHGSALGGRDAVKATP